MSLNEKKRTNQQPDIYLTEGICRSKSFGGLSHRRTNSADANFSSVTDITFDGSTTKTLYSTIGAAFSPNSSYSKNLSWAAWIHAIRTAKAGKLNKLPRPERTQIIFDCISKGLKESIHLAQNEISSSRLAFDNVSVSSVMQMKIGERYLKKLEFHLSKLEELKEKYDVQHKIRDGIRTMGYAYILSPGKLKETALQSVKSEFKDCTEIMCTYENNLEALMGSFLFEMIGIQGFARICSGDVFEVIVKHGDQKWKTRGRVIKNGDQLWENKAVSFKSLFNEPLCIKAMEVRGLGKNILLGNKYCETRDLFCAHPQQMTINLNPSGSLKLNLIITWNPLSGSADNTLVHSGTLSSTLPYSHSCGRHSISQSSMHETEPFSDLTSAKHSLTSNPHICDSTSQSFISKSISSSSAVESPSTDNVNEPFPCLHYDVAQNEPTFPKTKFLPENSNLHDSWTGGPNEENSDSNSVSSLDHNLTEALKILSVSIEDVLETYPEVVELMGLLDDIRLLLKGENKSTSNSNISISIESALECFDFLNTAIENSDNEDVAAYEKIENENQSYLSTSPDIERISNIEGQLCKLDLHPLSASSGNGDIDAVLSDHLVYCTKLISMLVSSGPFKCVKVSSLRKLRKQLSCISSILSIMKKSSFCVCDFFTPTEDDVYQIWTLISSNGLYSMADHFSYEMENVLRSLDVTDGYMASIVAQRLVADILDSSNFDPAARISVFQFKAFFIGCKAQSLILDFVTDTVAAEDLKSRNVQKAYHAVSELSKIVPSTYALFHIGSLLNDLNTDLKNAAISYLKAVSSNEDLQQKVTFAYLKMLHSGSTSSKIISCRALEILQAKHCIDHLSYIALEDSVESVQEAAKCVLRNFEVNPSDNSSNI